MKLLKTHLLTLLLAVPLTLSVSLARGQAEVQFSSSKAFPGGGLEINETVIRKHWFLFYPRSDSPETNSDVKDMHAAQINCEPSAPATDDSLPGDLQCSVAYYLQGRNEARFAGKGHAFEVTTVVNANIALPETPSETTLHASQVHSSKLIDPVLIRHKDYSFVIGRKSCAPDTVSKGQGSIPEAIKQRKLLFCGVGLSMKKSQEGSEASHWIDLDDISFSKSGNIAPEVFWAIRNNHLLLGGRQWYQVAGAEGNHQVSTATYMEKLNWADDLDKAIETYNEQQHDSKALSIFKKSIARAFSGFEIFPLTWTERTTSSDSIMDSSNYVALQPEMTFFDNFPHNMMVHMRTRIEFPGEEARRLVPAAYAEQNGIASSVVLKCHHYWGKMTCIPLSVFDNPWTKNTLQAFNGDTKKLYFVGHIAPSGSFKPGNRHQLYLYRTSLYQNFVSDDFSSKAIDTSSKTPLLKVPPAHSQFASDTTYPFFDPFTASNPEYDCALFVTTIRTNTQSGIAILCLDKAQLPDQKQ